VGRLHFRSREGDFIETSDGLIFDVKGMLHPRDRVIAYLRYLPDKNGRRERLGVRYRKVYDLPARVKLLRAKWPEYLYWDSVFNREIQAVPMANVKQLFVPTEKLRQLRHVTDLDHQQESAVDMATILAKEARVSASKIGVSGSILVDLHTSKSDIDLVLYGSRVARKCYSQLGTLLGTRSQGFNPYEKRDLHRLYAQRKQRASMPFDIFARLEQPKVLQGKFRGIDYFIRCVKDWDEWHEEYGDRKYYPAGRTTVHATISNDSESIFTPCTYRLVGPTAAGRLRAPTQIVSFRGRFCEQAHTGQRVRARGTLEKVVHHRGDENRLVIGEDPRDFLMVVG
jgi:hypothetical protein